MQEWQQEKDELFKFRSLEDIKKLLIESGDRVTDSEGEEEQPGRAPRRRGTAQESSQDEGEPGGDRVTGEGEEEQPLGEVGGRAKNTFNLF